MTVSEPGGPAPRPAGSVRQPAVAGMFYPADPRELESLLEDLLAGASTAGGAPKAIIAPHAGYPYSGPVAAEAYAGLRARRDQIRRVVLLGPAHRVYVRGLALPGADRFATPLGLIDIDREAVAQIRQLPQVGVMDAAHAQEHSLEVHLPFLQAVLDRFELVPLVVGEAGPDEVAEVLELLWGGEETLIVISSDLSHYYDYDTARAIDARTADNILKRRLENIGPYEACGCIPLHGLLTIARSRDLHIELLDLRNSGDTAGPRDRVVGYGSFAIESSAPALRPEHKRSLVEIAHASIRRGLSGAGPLRPDPGGYAAPLREFRAAFTTLSLDGSLRGCIGTTEAVAPLIAAVADSAFSAAFHDPRFNPLTQAEYERVAVSLSLLSAPQPLEFASESELLAQIRPGVHGLTIARGLSKGTFLPSVWEQIPTPAAFLQQLKRKAGMGETEAPEKAWTYTTESIGEGPEEVNRDS
jgi:AmmeMemoRadiSam system protein B/AmmeMemoRadiSam system protein A